MRKMKEKARRLKTRKRNNLSVESRKMWFLLKEIRNWTNHHLHSIRNSVLSRERIPKSIFPVPRSKFTQNRARRTRKRKRNSNLAVWLDQKTCRIVKLNTLRRFSIVPRSCRIIGAIWETRGFPKGIVWIRTLIKTALKRMTSSNWIHPKLTPFKKVKTKSSHHKGIKSVHIRIRNWPEQRALASALQACENYWKQRVAIYTASIASGLPRTRRPKTLRSTPRSLTLRRFLDKLTKRRQAKESLTSSFRRIRIPIRIQARRRMIVALRTSNALVNESCSAWVCLAKTEIIQSLIRVVCRV